MLISLSGFYISAEWTPLKLFANGEQGAWYDPSDLTTLYQDAAGTTPVTADGQSVGRMLDQSGNGNHASQPTSADRTLYQTGGTLHWSYGDGAGDNLLASLPVTDVESTGFFFSVAGSFDAFADYTYLFGASNSSNGVILLGLRISPTNFDAIVRGVDSSLVETSGPVRDTGTHVFTIQVSNGSLILRVDGVEYTAPTTGSAINIDQVSLHSLVTPTLNQSVQSTIYGGLMGLFDSSANDIDRIEAYLADLAGVTL